MPGLGATLTRRLTHDWPPGTPGASSDAEYRRLRQLAAIDRRRRLPALILVAILTSLMAGVVSSWFLGWLGVLVVVVAAGALVFRRLTRPSPEVAAWHRGAVGERRTAKLLRGLEEAGYVVLHDLALPDAAANVDHLVIGPTGIYVIDSKNWNSKARLHFDGARLEYAGLPQDRMLATVRWEAQRVAELLASALPPDTSVLVTPLVAVHGTSVPGGYLVAEGVGVLQANYLRRHIAGEPATFTPLTVAHIAEAVQRVLPRRSSTLAAETTAAPVPSRKFS